MADYDLAAFDGLPFLLSRRDPVTRIRKRTADSVVPAHGVRTQPMRGYDATYTDIVDYIVRITDEIWSDRAIGRIYDTYDPGCTVYSSYGVVRTVEDVVASTIASIHAFPDGETHHLNIAWSGDENDFYTSHLGLGVSTNLGATSYGPATGRRVAQRFVADCVSRDNRIHTEWLVRDAGAQVRQMGLDLHTVARAIAAVPPVELPIFALPPRRDAQVPRGRLDISIETADGWARHMFHELWNRRRLDKLGDYYATDIVVASGGGRIASGLRSVSALMLEIMAAVPDGVMSVEHVCHSEETDGVILAVRWLLQGTTRPGGMLGDVAAGLPANIMGMSHLRFHGAHIVEEWTVFDEVGVLVGAYRG